VCQFFNKNGEGESDIPGLVEATESLGFDESKEQKTTTIKKTGEEIGDELMARPEFRRDWYFLLCMAADPAELEKLFEKYPTDELHTCVTDQGSNGVLLAAALEDGLETIKWLQGHGVEIDQADHYGRTPLIKAALWGRWEAVRYFTAQGANVHAKDGNGMKAIDLAGDSLRNVNERSSGLAESYREPPTANRNRQLIVNHLKRISSSKSATPNQSRPQSRSFFIRDAEGQVLLYRAELRLCRPLNQSQKAYASLDRGHNYLVINAMSGYTQPRWPNVLDNDKWTTRADDLRQDLGFSSDRSRASHVEPQLLAYLVWHHMCLAWIGGCRETD
jgi:hypothetical protein